MSDSIYSPALMDRLNPEFIGIAKKFSSSKARRQTVENQRDSLLRTLKYKMSMDLGLQKNLQQQKQRLKEVKSVYERRAADDQFKRDQAERKKAKLRSLNTSAKEQREQMKRNVKHALVDVFARKRNSREEEQRLEELLERRMQQQQEWELAGNKGRFREVKCMERHSKNTVNKYYRTANKESLNAYKTWMTEEQEKAEEYNEQIKMMEKAISKFQGKIERKKGRIYSIFSQIEGYTAESTESQSRCLPLCLRSNKSMSSHSSRPKDLLLRGPKQILEKAGLGQR